ncbi:phosphate/phosphite/phosphonate ABC transporter substrate-binding protein [Sphaerotilus montanus]|uniref:Phosphonate transport system substrate-binding protein n=1 Tax=Sphaerotilus montanus TaxID=522889 RepID=A0A7Y9R2G0_9BURK|nr:phosphonate transport system substrate-binding protein [Sphaerotilus montanus]NZD59368.1 phosphate/phosphite/phosphonate ABC transporter substrate-binding protein [Sphaerotilus montanus]
MSTWIRRIAPVARSLGTALLLTGTALAAQAQSVLRVAMAPETTPAEQAVRFEPLGQFLETRFKMRVKWVPVASEAFAVRALLNREADLVWLNGLSYVQAVVRAGDRVVPLVQREEDQKARSVFITKASSSIKKLPDLKGRTLSLGPSASTAENLMPRSALIAAKLRPDADLTAVPAANAAAVVAAVVAGQAEAGALGLATWERLVADKQVDPAALKVFFTTPVYTDHTWAVLADLPEGSRKAITGGMLVLEAVKGGREILKAQRAHRYTETKDAGYAAVRAAAEQTGQLQ